MFPFYNFTGGLVLMNAPPLPLSLSSLSSTGVSFPSVQPPPSPPWALSHYRPMTCSPTIPHGPPQQSHQRGGNARIRGLQENSQSGSCDLRQPYCPQLTVISSAVKQILTKYEGCILSIFAHFKTLFRKISEGSLVNW